MTQRPTFPSAWVPKWRGSTVTTLSITGMVLGEPVDGVASVYDAATGLTYRVGVEALTHADQGPR